jgi:hypothetical protein
VYWYETVVVVQTNTLVLVGTFSYALGPYYHLLAIMAALGLIGVLLLCIRPHKCAAAGQVSLQSVGVLYLTAFTAMTFLPYRNITPPPGYSMAMGVLVLVAHVTFVLCTLWRLLRLVNWVVLIRFIGCCYQKTRGCCCKGGLGASGVASPVRQSAAAGAVGLDVWLKGCCACQQPVQPPQDVVGHAADASKGAGSKPVV